MDEATSALDAETEKSLIRISGDGDTCLIGTPVKHYPDRMKSSSLMER